MKLVSLELRQWRSFPELDLEFPDGLVGIRGANGAGKTTIAEAIGWTLFGKLRPGAKIGDLKRQGAPPRARSTATLTFRLGPTLYRVERVVGGSAKLWIGDAEEPETSQTNATNQRIVQELDLTWETFQRTVFARQKDVAALDPGARGEDRKRHVERLLGLERFRVAAEKARSRAKELEQQLIGLREQAPDLKALRLELEEAEKAAAAGDPAVAGAKAVEAQARVAVAEADSALERERSRRERHERLTDEAARVKREIADLDGDLERKREQLTKRARNEAELASLNGHDHNLDELELRRRAWVHLADCAEELDQRRADSRPDVDTDAAAARRAELAEATAEYESLLTATPPDADALRRRVAALEAVAAAPAPDTACDRLAQVTAERDRVHGDLATLRARIEEDEHHLADIAEGGADVACPSCLRPYGEDYQSILDAHHERLAQRRGELDDLVDRCADLDSEQASAERDQAASRDAAAALGRTTGPADLDDAGQALADAETTSTARDRRLEELRTLRSRLQPEVQDDEERQRGAQDQIAALTAAQQRFSQAAAAAGVDTYEPARKQAAIQAHEQALEAATKRQVLTAALEATAALAPEVEKLDERREQRAHRLGEIGDQLSEMAFDVDEIARLRTACEEATHALERAADELRSAELDAVGRDQRVGELRSSVAEAERQDAVIAERETEAREYRVAGDLLSEYRTAQHQRAWPKLEIGASSLLSETTDGRYADVRLSNDYKLVIVDRGEEHGLERYSGGEQDLANLCLRLAIADWVARERGVETGFVVLDEVFGSQDEERRQRLLGQLRSLSNRFHQLLVITHLPDIAELCEHQLQVELVDDGHSVASFVT